MHSTGTQAEIFQHEVMLTCLLTVKWLPPDPAESHQCNHCLLQSPWLKPSAHFLVVSRLALAHCKKPVISVSPTLLGHTDKLFFENKEGKQHNKRKNPAM